MAHFDPYREFMTATTVAVMHNVTQNVTKFVTPKVTTELSVDPTTVSAAPLGLKSEDFEIDRLIIKKMIKLE